MRGIILDIETTGLFVNEGHRITEIGMVEIKDGKPTGKTYHSYINPERDVPEFITELTGLTEKFLSDKPTFDKVAAEVRNFIGNMPVIITCRSKDGYTLDIAFLNHELEQAGNLKVPEKQWINVRHWAEAMFGYDEARLDKMLGRYKIDRTERDENGHGALLDAQLLAKIYPKLLADYQAFGLSDSQFRKKPPLQPKGPKR